MTERVAVFPPKESALGWGSWARELAVAAFDIVVPHGPVPSDVPRGNGSTVLVIPGFLSGDLATIRLRTFLRGLGYRSATAGIFANAGPTPAIMQRLDRVLQRLAGDGPVALIGVSLGGTLARDLARRHPGNVRCVVTLCSPVRFPVTTPLEPFARVLAPLHADDWVARRHDIADPLDVPVTAIHASDDGVLERRACVLEESPLARNVAVEGRHMTIASNPQALAAAAFALAGP
jgi:pimeloyl-ACP methyl ester carboxylesterase